MSATTDPELGLNRIRGWLLVFTVALTPHIVLGVLNGFGSWRALTLSPATASDTTEWLRFTGQSVIAVGHSAGLVLILIRSRYAPAYFTLYLPFLFVLFLADPDPLTTQVMYAQRLGLTPPTELEGARHQAMVRTALSIVATLACLGYWLRSHRVRAVFGSTGLGILRGNTR